MKQKVRTKKTSSNTDKDASQDITKGTSKAVIASLMAEGIVASKTNKLNLTQSVSRAEAAVFLKRVYDKVNK